MANWNQGDVIGARFVIEELAGEGGMGAIYRAVDRTTGKTVALKVLMVQGGAATRRFEQEAALLAALSDPSIVGYVAHGTTERQEPFLAMEWLEGEDLAERLERGPLSLHDAVAVARGAAQALAVVHAHGVVHRDVKPANLFLVERDPSRTSLLDFGLSYDKSATRITATGRVAGTPGYVAPEQLRGGALDPRADVFALGCVLFECIAGRPAFRGGSPLEVLAQIAVATVPSLAVVRPNTPPELVTIVARMLAKDPEDRFEDASAVLRALDAVKLPPRTPPRRPEPTRESSHDDVALADTIAPPARDRTRRSGVRSLGGEETHVTGYLPSGALVQWTAPSAGRSPARVAAHT